MRISTILAALPAFLIPIVSSASLSISIAQHASLLHPSLLGPQTKAFLTTSYTTLTAPISAHNTFNFRNVTPGSYQLDITSPSHDFLPYRVDVAWDGQYDGIAENGAEVKGEIVSVWGTYRGNAWGNKGETVDVVKRGGGAGKDVVFAFEVKVRGARDYYMPRNTFSPFAMLKNPMILIAGFSMLVIFGMPYLIDNMDPELKEEFNKQQKNGGVAGMLAGGGGGAQQQQNNAAQSLANFDAAAWLAGSAKR